MLPTPEKEKINWNFLRKAFVWAIIVFFAFNSYAPRLNTLKDKQEIKSYGWGFFHYYLGAKYFNEVGYFDFYNCVVEAGKGNIKWNDYSAVRGLRSYELTTVENLTPCNKTNFSDLRWEEYKKDVLWAYETESVWGKENMRQLVTDKGFNATPFWAVLAGVLTQIFPLWLLVDLDLILFVVSIVLIWYLLGEKISRITSLFILFYFGTFLYLGGQFMQYIWFPLLVGSILSWHKNRPILSGFVGGLSIGLYSFPIFFALPFFIYTLRRPFKINVDPYVRFSVSCIATLIFCFVIGSTSSQGVKAWISWSEKISIHSEYLKGEVFNMGLPVFSSTVFSNDKVTYYTYEEQIPQTQKQLQTFYEIKYFVWFLSTIVLIWWLQLVWKTKEKTLFGYGYVPLYLLTALSPFYHLSIVLLPLMFWNASKNVTKYIVWGISFLILINMYFLLKDGYINFNYHQHLLSGTLLFMFIFGLMFILQKDSKISS